MEPHETPDAKLTTSRSLLNKGASLHWRDLTVSVPLNAKPKPKGASDVETGDAAVLDAGSVKHILRGVSGYVEPGQVLFIMGPSGSGKTTLLDALAGRLGASVSGGQYLDGAVKSDRALRSAAKYVQQEDDLLGVLSVRETLDFYAGLYIPASDAGVRAARVAEVMDILGLTAHADTRVGNAFVRGLSGGQKRRLSVGAELVASPRLLFLDEPTSGLDSATAFHVMKQLRRIAADTGTAVVATVHQPSQRIFEMADNLLLLSGGRPAYFGPAGDAAMHFRTLGLEAPSRASDVEWMLDVVNQDFGETDMVTRCLDAWDSSSAANALRKVVDAATTSISQAANSPMHSTTANSVQTYGYNVSFLQQTKMLTWRGLLNSVRNPAVLWLRFAMYVMLSVLIGLVWLRLDFSAASIIDTNNALFYVCAFMIFMSVSVLPAYLEERAVLIRERANNAYSIGAYIVSHTLYELPYVLVLAVAASAVVYSMVGLRPGFDHFVVFAANLFTSLLVAESMMVLIAAMCPILIVGIAAGAMTFGMFMCVQGAFISIERIGWWLRWVKFVAVHFYSYSTFLVNQYKDRTYPAAPENIFPPYPNPVSGDSVYQEKGLEERMWVNFVAQIAMVVVYRAIASGWLHMFVRGKK